MASRLEAIAISLRILCSTIGFYGEPCLPGAVTGESVHTEHCSIRPDSTELYLASTVIREGRPIWFVHRLDVD